MILSILIPSLEKRNHLLNDMLACIGETTEDFEIVTLIDQGEVSTGSKRNTLLNMAIGEYVWFVDDDDELLNGAVNKVIEACKTGADVITYNGFMTTNGTNREDFEIRLGHGYETVKRNGKNFYLRYPNHINPMKREIALQVGFPDLTYKEDYIFAKELNDRGLLKAEFIINEDLYHYKYIKDK